MWNSSAGPLSPKAMTSPSVRWTSPSTRLPLMKVPFLLPRSLKRNPSGACVIEACRDETSRSRSASKRTSDRGWRPIPMYALAKASTWPARAPERNLNCAFTGRGRGKAPRRPHREQEDEPPGACSARRDRRFAALVDRYGLRARLGIDQRIGLVPGLLGGGGAQAFALDLRDHARDVVRAAAIVGGRDELVAGHH